MTQIDYTVHMGAILGSGFFGDVFSAIHPVHGEVAIKVPRRILGESDLDWQARKAAMITEGLRMQAAKHKNIVQVHHVGTTPSGDTHLVMEHCGRGSLQSRYMRGPMSCHDVQHVMTQILLGLQSLHIRGMLHRDIKPGNILIDSLGIAKLGDFGLVTDKLLLGYGSQAGYSDHISPEVWAGGGTSVKSDVWSIGMTIYRLLHGHDWYSCSPAPRTVVKDGGFADRLTWLPHIPAPWRRFIRKAMHDDTDFRHQDAAQLINGLATLPTSPPWECQVYPTKTEWTYESYTRRFVVTSEKIGTRDYRWKAISSPKSKGNSRRLAGSIGDISRSESERQLKDFFASHG